MAVFKCKMCGGTLEVQSGESVAVCDSCGTKQTLPNLSDERRANLYDRANYFRRNGEFDKAEGIFESILAEDNKDAEAYWSLVLCKYGINYVTDPRTHKQVPTVNRAQYTPVQTDGNYLSALEHADGYQRDIYEAEAKAIDKIQKGILAISQREDPFDVFICYKETDDNDERTQDSVYAQDIYNALTKEGFKVFFSRITLEDKLGSEYEPYIFAALNSAKVMLVVGTSRENLEAVWVKNEWSRYLQLIRKGEEKTLIPVYANMSPYDLPDEFSNLMAQDMSKIGFMQDLVRGIKKVSGSNVQKTAVKETVVINGGNANTTPLLKRAFMFLEDEDWKQADEYCERVLDQDPENAQAYLGKLMAELRIGRSAELADCEESFEGNSNFQKALRFADTALAGELNGYIASINDRKEQERLEAESRAAAKQAEASRLKEERKKANDAAKQKLKKYLKIALPIIAGCITLFFTTIKFIIPTIKYNAAVSLMNDGKYTEAISSFEALNGYKDSEEQITSCHYNEAVSLMNDGKYSEAISAFEALNGYKDSAEQISSCRTAIKDIDYNAAVSLMNDGEIIDAYDSLIALNGYKDSSEKAAELFDRYKVEKIETAGVGDTVLFGAYEQDNNTTNGKENVEWIVLAKENGKALVVSKYALDSQPYNERWVAVTWESCSLRKWLNSTFLNTAFNAEEKAMIQDTKVPADKNPKYNTNPGNATTDKVFLLSINEANQYFSSDEARKCTPTEYAIANGAYVNDSGYCWWWLRSPGDSQRYAAYVGFTSFYSVYAYGSSSVGDAHVCVRPAMWINLDSNEKSYIGISVGDIQFETAKQLDIEGGAYVYSVTKGGPADKAGLQEGDIIFSVNGKTVLNSDAIVDAIGEMTPGTEANLSVMRNGKQINITVIAESK